MVRVAMPVGVKRVRIALVTAALLLLDVGTAPAQSAGTVVGISGACLSCALVINSPAADWNGIFMA